MLKKLFGALKVLIFGDGSRQIEEKTPTADDLKKRALYLAVIKLALQNPGFLLPIVGAILLGLVGALFESGTAWFFAMLCLLGSVGTGLYFLARANHYADQQLQHLKRLRARHMEQEVVNYTAEFRRIGFKEGADAASELHDEYQLLKKFLNENSGAGLAFLNIERYKAMAEDVVEQASVLLIKARNTFKVLNSIDCDKLKDELESWRTEVGILEKEDAAQNSHRIAALRSKIEGHESRIALYEKRDGELDSILAQVERLEGILEKNRLVLIDLVGVGDRLNIKDQDLARFEREVKLALRMEEKRSGNEQREQDAMYERLGGTNNQQEETES